MPIAPLIAGLPVGKRKSDPSPEPARDKQVNFRANSKLMTRLEAVADAFGVDVSNLVRLVLNENLAKYEKRADRVRQGLPAEEDAG